MVNTDVSTLITRSSDEKNRPTITGAQASVRRVVVIYKQGAGAEEISGRLSYLSLAQVYAGLTYYHTNRDEIESDLAEEEAEYCCRLAALHHKQAEQVQK